MRPWRSATPTGPPPPTPPTRSTTNPAAYAADAVYYEPANPPHEGREAIRAYLNDLLKGHRNLRVDIQRLGVDGDSAIVEWTWSFRTGDRRVTGQPGASVIQVGPSGIVYHRDYL